MVSDFNIKHRTQYKDFEELSEQTGLTLEEFLWELGVE